MAGSSIVFCCRAGFFILSLCLHPSLFSAARLSASWPSSFAVITWILLPVVGLPLILPSISNFAHKSVVSAKDVNVSFARVSSVFAWRRRNSFTLLRTCSLVTLSVQLIFSILLHIHISQASNLLLSVWVNVHVSAAYSATLQTKHFIVLF